MSVRRPTTRGGDELLLLGGGEALLFAQQAQQDVLGADVIVLEGPRLLLSQDDDLASSLCESLKQTPKNPTRRDRSQPARRLADVDPAAASPLIGSRLRSTRVSTLRISHVNDRKRDSSRKETVAEGDLVRAGSPAACGVP